MKRARLILLVCALFAPAVIAAQSSAADSASTRKRLERSASQFLRLWQKQWQLSLRTPDAMRPVPIAGEGSERFRNVHCHWDGSYYGADGRSSPLGPPPSVIKSSKSRFGICPWWAPDVDSLEPDESDNTDAALSARAREIVVPARRILIAELDSAAKLFPNDGWISGQRVRFNLDMMDLRAAQRAVEECSVDRAWCASLQGLVFYRRGHVAEADAAFQSATQFLTESQACSWGSIAALLSQQDQKRYQALSCKEQLRTNRIFWWLADPMYSEAGNERRAEHFARRMRVILHSSLPTDGVYSYESEAGGDAVQVMLLRYGWPTHSWWGGPAEDSRHSSWLMEDAVEPYTVPEYSMQRISVVPEWDAIMNPLTTTNEDFALHAPAKMDPRVWWPREHMRRANGTIIAVEEGQHALFRRDSATTLVLAARLMGEGLEQRIGERVDATFVLSPAPDTTYRAERERSSFGQRLFIRTELDSLAGLAGIEIQAMDSSKADARSRFGLIVPAPLHALAAGTQAVSTPLLFQIPGSDVPMPDDLESAVEQMYASLRIAAPTRIGVFWESYGFKRGDSVSISVRLQRITSPGRWQRLGMALGLAEDPNSAVTINWSEPQPGRSSREIPGLIPILGRQLVLNIDRLIAGDYRLQVTMESPGRSPVSNERVFSITR